MVLPVQVLESDTSYVICQFCQGQVWDAAQLLNNLVLCQGISCMLHYKSTIVGPAGCSVLALTPAGNRTAETAPTKPASF